MPEVHFVGEIDCARDLTAIESISLTWSIVTGKLVNSILFQIYFFFQGNSAWYLHAGLSHGESQISHVTVSIKFSFALSYNSQLLRKLVNSF